MPISIDLESRLTWEQLKLILHVNQRYLEDQNGLDHCKNCGTDFTWLIKQIEGLVKKVK